MNPAFSIRFPMVREKTGNRTGPRFRRVVSNEGLHGARRWGRDCEWFQLCVELDAHSVRESALWARRFARGIADTDPRFAEIEAQGKALRARLNEHTQRHNALAA